MLTFRFDYTAKGRGIGATPIAETPEGYKVYRGVAAFGDVVLEYPEDGVNEFAPTADVMGPGIAESIIATPFTILHPDDLLDADDPETIQAKTVGTVRAARANLNAKPPELEVEVVVWTRPAQEDIESGRVVELSPGYQRDPEKAPKGAAYGGKRYDVVQRRRRYNHLSGVISARGVTPDGRRARLDEAGSGEVIDIIRDTWGGPPSAEQGALSPSLIAAGADSEVAATGVRSFISALAREDASAAYAPLRMDDLIIAGTPSDETPAGERTDAAGDPPPAPMDAPVVGEEVIEVAGGEGEAMPSALAMFSPDDAEVLKQLSPEGLAALMMALKQQKAEAAEQAVLAAPPGAAEVEISDAPPPAAADPAAAPADAVAPMAPQGVTATDAPPAPAAVSGLTESIVMDMITKVVGDMCGKMTKDFADAMKSVKSGGSEDRKDAIAPAKLELATRIDAAAVAKQIAETRRMDAAFVEHARKDGHLGAGEAATVKAAATKMYAVVAEHLPDLAPMAKAALADPKRRDGDFIAIYQAAEKKRRDALMDDQASIFGAFGMPDPEAAAGLSPDSLSLLQD